MRRPVLFILSLGLLLVFLGCSRPSTLQHRLEQLDSLVDEHPDSVLRVLETLADSVDAQPDAVRMRYALLKVKAEDKADITYTTDSIILQIVDYYERHFDSYQTPEAYYYAGRVYTHFGVSPRALNYYNKSLKTIPQDSQDSILIHLRSLVHVQRALVFSYQGLHPQALDSHQHALADFELMKDSLGIMCESIGIGDTFYALEQNDSALFYYDKAEQVAIQSQSAYMKNIIVQAKVKYYMRFGRFKEALSLNSSLFLSDSIPVRYIAYYIQGELYHREYKLDSARYYYRKVLKTGDVWTKVNASKGLGEIAIMQGRPMEAVTHFNDFIFYADSSLKLRQQEAVMKAHQLFNYQLREEENEILNQDNARKEKQIIFCIFLLFIILIFSFALYRHQRARQLEAKLQIGRLKRWQEEQYMLSQQYQEDNRTKIQQLETLLASLESDKTQSRPQLQRQIESLQCLNSIAEQKRENQEAKNSQIMHQEEYRLLQSYVQEGKIIKPNLWPSIEKAVNDVFPGFTDKLKELSSLNEIDMQVCLLTKMNFSPTDIAVLIGRVKSSVSMLRKRLFLKTFGKNGGPKEWDEFIRSL